MRKCRIGTAKFFTLLLLLYRTSVKDAGLEPDVQEYTDAQHSFIESNNPEGMNDPSESAKNVINEKQKQLAREAEFEIGKWINLNEWHTPKAFSDAVTSDNITLDSLTALRNKKDNVKILFDCSVRDYNLSMAQRFFDEGSQQEMPFKIGKAEGNRFQQILKQMVSDMQEQIPGCGIYIWDEKSQADGHLTVHTAAGTKIFFDSKSRNPSMAQWLENAVNGKVESFGMELLDRNYSNSK